MTTTATHTTTCKRCGRTLISPSSVATGYGPTCARIIRTQTADYTPEQTAKAFRLVQEGGVTRIPSKHYRLYAVQGTYTTYQSDGIDCTCAGAREYGTCYHVEAVRIHLAAA